MGNSIGGFLGTIYALFIVGIVIFLAYIATRFIGSKYMRTLNGKNIMLVESTSLGLDKTLYLVKIGNQYFLIASSGKTINFLSEVKSSNIDFNSTENSDIKQKQDKNTFAKYLQTINNKFSQKQNISNDTNTDINIDRNVDKIKNIFNNIKVPDKDGVE